MSMPNLRYKFGPFRLISKRCYKHNCSVIYTAVIFYHSNWLKIFHHPIRMLKNECDISLSQNFFIGPGPGSNLVLGEKLSSSIFNHYADLNGTDNNSCQVPIFQLRVLIKRQKSVWAKKFYCIVPGRFVRPRHSRNVDLWRRRTFQPLLRWPDDL